MFDLQTPILGWWMAALIVPAAFLVFLAVRVWHKPSRLIGTMALLSCIVALVVAGLYPLARKADCYFQLAWQVRQADGSIHHWFFTGDSVHGGLGVCLRGSTGLIRADGLARLGRDPAGDWGVFPTAVSKYALFHWKFLEETLGFQVCANAWIPGDPNFTLYSISAPHWFLMLLTPWFPLAWYRRRRLATAYHGFPVTHIERGMRRAMLLFRRRIETPVGA